MKRIGNLWDQFVSWPNVLLASKKAQRGKRKRPSVRRFAFNVELELLRIEQELRSGAYRPGAFETHWITQPKPRLISAAPYRDRVFHHALMNVLEPILDKRFCPFSFACRKGKGTHAAADHVQSRMRRYRFALQCDIQKFFPSIDHKLLKEKFRRVIKDKRVLALMDLIVDASNPQENRVEYFAGDDLWTPHLRRHGLPIGNLTSQWFANWYLSDLDHWITCESGIGGYARYCDDFILLDDDRDRLRGARQAIEQRLARSRLRMHASKVRLVPVEAGLTFVGFRLFPNLRLLRKPNVRSFRRRVRRMRMEYANGRIDWTDIRPRLASWVGHARQADSGRLLRRLGREWQLHAGQGRRLVCCGAGRGTTIHATAAVPTVTGTRLRTGTTTQGSGSCCTLH